ncbi:hypothetical protein ACP70R_028222 [Stipagrostis hirtigluma subsp. patula]
MKNGITSTTRREEAPPCHVEATSDHGRPKPTHANTSIERESKLDNSKGSRN